MTTLTITATNQELTINAKRKAGGRCYAEYVYHDAVSFNNIIVNGIELYAEYQTGCSYEHNDYSCPSNDWQLYDGHSNDLLVALDRLVESDFDDEESLEKAHEKAEDIFCRKLSTEELFQIYQFLNDNKPDSITSEDENVDNYEFDEDGFVVNKD